MKKYLFIAYEGHPSGGSEFLWSAAAERLARRGNQVRVSTKNCGAPVPQFERLRAAGCEVFYRPPAIRPFFQRQIRRIIPHPPYHEEHLRAIGNDADLVVISQGANLDGLPWMEAALSAGRKYAVISQAANEQWWPADWIAKRARRCFEASCAAFFVSEENLCLSRMQFGAPIANGRVVRNPFNVRYQSRPLWPAQPADSLSLACVARLDTAQKGQDLLIQVLDRPRWRARDVRVTLAGTGIHEAGLRALVEKFRLTNVEFAGHVQDIEGVWARHHALVLPSRFEGTPLALVEAMLCGRPAVVTDVGGNCELVRDNINGFVAKAATVDLVDEALDRAWGNRHRLCEMGEAAARDVRQRVSPDPAEDFVRELESLVNGKCNDAVHIGDHQHV